MTRWAILASASALAWSGGASAATCVWQVGASSWATAGNWSCGAVPTLNDDATIGPGGTATLSVGTGNRDVRNLTIAAGGAVSVSGGAQLFMYGSSFALNGSFTNNSAVYNQLASGWQNWAGSGTFTMQGGSYLSTVSGGAKTAIGAGITVAGNGSFGSGGVIFANAGVINANLGGGTLTIDPTGGRTGSATAGQGTGGSVTFLNTGTLRAARTVGASGTATLSLGDGLYENGDGGVMEALASGQLTMSANANLLNLSATGVLSKGTYRAGGGGTVALRSYQGAGGTAVTGITTIGTAAANTDTIVELSGNASQIAVLASSGTGLSSTLATIAQSGRLIIGGQATFTSSPGLFQVNGILTLGDTVGLGQAVLKQVGVGATGEIAGFGILSATGAVSNSGLIRASGGTLQITTPNPTLFGGTGTFASDSGATLSLSGITNTATMTFGTLVNNGLLALGNGSVTVATDYQNAAFGSGAAFNRRANVTGTGAINAVAGTRYAIRLANGDTRSGTIALGSIRVGDIVPLAQIANTSTTAITLRGAAYSDQATRYSVDNASWALGQNATSVVKLTALSAGALNQLLTTTSNFANVTAQTAGFSAAVYQAAIARSQQPSINLGSVRVGGTLSQAFTFGNAAPNVANYSEALISAATASGAFRIGGGTNLITNAMAAGTTSGSTLSLLTTTAGAYSGTLGIANTSQAVAGSGLSNLNLANQSIALSGKVYQAAIAAAQPTSIALSARRVGDSAASAGLLFGNVAPNVAGYTETLLTGATSSGAFRVNGGTSFVSPELAAGAASSTTLTLLTATAGSFNGLVNVGGTSHAVTGSGLTDLALVTQNIAVTGKVYAPALAQVSQLAVDLGYVRPGEAKAGSVTLTNGATGALADRLAITASASNGFNAGSAADLTQGQSATLAIGFGGSTTSGLKTGTVDLALTSKNADMADLLLAGKQIDVAATVTELAKASIYKAGGSGTLTGGGTSYTLNLGNVWYKAGTVTTNFGLTNAIAANSWSENLGGSWTALSGSSAYSFSAEAIGLIGAGASIQNGVLSFFTANQSLGAYLTSFDFKPVSKMNGMSDAEREAIHVNVIANLVAVPEPATWAQLIAGFGLLGGVARRRKGLHGASARIPASAA